ncbi:MAG: WhiB family transcriptional regulator [Acidimicrobiia bacterium]|nr:WhiB family transcriptional regulator [Acidimicrobiia bacterium]MCY4457214.1 WhiB family transcriptional regulator [Acidimicrobiaceae bacterium]
MISQVETIDWQLRAACRGPQAIVFFPPLSPERRDQKRIRERHAKAICETCIVREDCLAHALAIREQHGIWGGLNAREREKLWAV